MKSKIAGVQPRCCVEVVTKLPSNIETHSAEGWGKKAEWISIHGDPMKIVISRDGETKISITIDDDGSLTFCDHGNMVFSLDLPRNFSMTPFAPWKK